MLWEQFRSLALPLLGEHFPPNLIKDNGDSIVFTSRRDYSSYVLTEDERGIVIAYEGERNTVVSFCITWPGLVLWTGCFEGCWLLLVVLCPLARVLVG